MDDDQLLEVLHEAVTAVAVALEGLGDWGLAGTRPDQYRSDLAADEAAVPVLLEAGLGVLSEESGPNGSDRPIVAVLDPVDGSTNAAQGLPWFGTSVCAVDEEGPRVAVVANQASGVRFDAVRGGGARRAGRPLRPSGCEALERAIVGLSGYPARHLGWRQFRALGAAALDLCAVAEGSLDAYVDCSGAGQGPWDYLGGALVCLEARAVVADARGRHLVALDHSDRRAPVAAATPALLSSLVRARASLPVP
ncbi:MAG TPA: inositol monophosphatase family protein [Acidimicrobiales bacterium]|nr:inositol monophosphatase family protein [Acidimicrobiales bacterium]